MQIELIAPVSTASATLPRLGLGLLAASTPASDEIIYTDEVVRPFDLERDVKDVDLVGISVDSKTARRSYDIADAYRRRGRAGRGRPIASSPTARCGGAGRCQHARAGSSASASGR